MQKLLANQYLAGLAQQAGWDLRIGPAWSCLVVPTYADCRYIAKHYSPVLGASANTDVPTYVEYGGSDRHLCRITPTGEVVSIQIDGLDTNRALLDAFGEMLSNPQRSMGLVRIPDERQISVSGGAGGRFLIGKTKEEATQQRRADYWHPGDLLAFNRDWRREMSIDGDWFEASYRCFPTGSSAQFCNNRFITRYKLLEGPDGTPFHLCENLGVEAV